MLQHHLQQHPLFSFDALFGLCRRLPSDQVRYRAAVVPANAHFDSSLGRFRGGLSLDDAINHLSEKQAYIAIYNPETDPEYRPVMEGLLGELALATRGQERRFNWYSTYIFISAAEAITPYHMDREMNFLLQIQGSKTVRLWDPNDDAVMSPPQRDQLFSQAYDARPTYHPRLDARAHLYALKPGLGVHHPFIAPHLVQTGPQPSISLAITFRSPRSDDWSDAHRFNHYFMRPLGLGGMRVGRSALEDGARARIFRAVNFGKRLISSAGRVAGKANPA